MSRRIPRFTAAALALAALAASVPASGADGPGWTVSVTPTKVVDGQAVSITVKAAPGFTVYSAEAKLCRAGVTYQPSAAGANRPAADFESGGPNCPITAISTSADVSANDPNTLANAGSAAGESFLYRVGAGVTTWPFPLGSGKQASLTCGVGNPCVLVVELRVGQGSSPSSWQPFVQPLTYADDDPFAGCGGPADGVLASGSSDRMSDTWVNWSIDECQRPGRKGAASRASFVGEGDAVKSYASGGLDLAYSAGGYDDEMGLAPPSQVPGGARRASVSVPAALNAAVIAVGGGVPVQGHKVPYRDVQLTLAEVAGLISGGVRGIAPYLPDIAKRNADLTVDDFFDTSSDVLVGASAGPDADSWYLTRLLAKRVPDAWKVPDVSTFEKDAGRTRGVDADLAQADPSFVNAISLLTGRPPMRKALAKLSPTNAGGIWFLTDLATARSLGLTPVQIQNASGAFVAPTESSMAAAVPAMKRDKYGVLIADPNASAGADNVQPYPLTFVEYALAPAEPLLADGCTTRDASQALLAGWLKYITGPGQAKLAPGMVPLTPDLAKDAAQAIPKVGAADVTGSCKGKVKNAGTQPAGTPSGSGSGGSGGGAGGDAGGTAGPAGGGSGSPSGGQGGAGQAPAGRGATAAPASRATKPGIAPVPVFSGRSTTPIAGLLLALLGVGFLSSVAAFGTRSGELGWRARLSKGWSQLVAHGGELVRRRTRTTR